MHVFVPRLLALAFFASPYLSQAQNDPVSDPVRQDATVGSPVRSYLPFVFDLDLTMRTGTENLVALHNHLTRIEDNRLGLRWFSEDQIQTKAAGIALRLVKYGALDLPADYFTVVFGHEYFGHGARYRELDIGNVHYGFDAPPPYGDGGGEASVSVEGNVISDHEVLSIWSGGIESHSLINRRLGLRWLARDRIDYREASLYFWSWQILFTYVQDSEEDLSALEDENDPQAYVRLMNSHAGYTDLNNLPFRVTDLKSSIRVGVVNPLVLYSMYAVLKTYLLDGEATLSLPALKYRSVSYLPLLRAGLTPFGPEYHLENYLRVGSRVALLDLRKGDETFFKSWGGAGVIVQNFYESDEYSLDARFETWKQPALEFGPIPSEPKGGGWGGAGSLRGYYDFLAGSVRLSWMGEIGYKSAGFLEGYALDAGPHFAVGIAIRE